MCAPWEPRWWTEAGDGCMHNPSLFPLLLPKRASKCLANYDTWDFLLGSDTIFILSISLWPKKRGTSPSYVIQTKGWVMNNSSQWKHTTCLYQLRTYLVEFTQSLKPSLSVYFGNWIWKRVRSRVSISDSQPLVHYVYSSWELVLPPRCVQSNLCFGEVVS